MEEGADAPSVLISSREEHGGMKDMHAGVQRKETGGREKNTGWGGRTERPYKLRSGVGEAKYAGGCAGDFQDVVDGNARYGMGRRHRASCWAHERSMGGRRKTHVGVHVYVGRGKEVEDKRWKAAS